MNYSTLAKYTGIMAAFTGTGARRTRRADTSTGRTYRWNKKQWLKRKLKRKLAKRHRLINKGGV